MNNSFLFDFHTDVVTCDELSLEQKLQYVVEQSKRHSMVLALWTSKYKLSIAQIYEVIKPYRDLNLNNVYFGIEDINLDLSDFGFSNIDANSTNIQIDALQAIASLPFLYYGLVWNNSNIYATSCTDSIDDGLSAFGKQLVATLLKHNKVIDLAHASKRTMYDVIDVLDGKNLVCTHTCFDAVHHHVRNLDIAQCKALVEHDAMIGMTLVSQFLGGDSIEYVLRHIEWFAEKFGVDNLCIGTDLYGTTSLKNLETYDKIAESIEYDLSKRGWKQDDVDAVLYGNLQNYIDKVLKN